MKKLNSKELKFAELCVTLCNKTEAYKQAYDHVGSSAGWIRMEASKIAKKPHIAYTISNLKKSISEELAIDRNWIIKQHIEIIDWYKELKALAKKDNLSKEEKSRVYMLKDLIKGSDFRGSLDSISKMLGLNEPDKIDLKISTFTTKWGD